MTDRELIYNTLLNGIPCGIMGSVTHYDEETNKPVEVVGQIKGSRDNGYVEFYYPDGSFNLFKAADVKPYLRRMSSMTDEEKGEILELMFGNVSDLFYIDDNGLIDSKPTDFMKEGLNTLLFAPKNLVTYIDWLNSHHFDYCGFIKKGLALEAPEGMYNK